MRNNNIDEKLAILQTINRVDTPPFLFTKILQRTKTAPQNNISFRQAFALSTAFLLVLALNVALLLREDSNSLAKNQSEMNLVESMNLSSNNIIYYE